jgi:dephospho-CoA kinase
MIIGLTGTNGAGKGSIGKYLQMKGFAYHSLSDIIREEADKRGLEKTRDNMRVLGNELREEGENILAVKTIEKIRKNNEENTAVDSIRNPAEIEEFRKQKDFVLIAVDAPISTRYERIKPRKRPEDQVDFETFRTQEEAEIAGGKGKQQIKKCMEMADFHIMNDSSKEKLNQKVDEILITIQKSS